MTEPDVALTDYLVTLECAVLTGLLFRRAPVRPELRRLFALLFASAGIAALAGWSIGGRLLFTEGTARLVEGLAAFEWVVYAVVVLAIDQRFWIAVANYAPSVIFLTVSFLVVYLRRREAAILAGLGGMVLTIAAAVVQRLRISPHPDYFNHNALYHVIQMIAFALVFVASRHLTPGAAPPSDRSLDALRAGR